MWKTEELVAELEPAQNQHLPGFEKIGLVLSQNSKVLKLAHQNTEDTIWNWQLAEHILYHIHGHTHWPGNMVPTSSSAPLPCQVSSLLCQQLLASTNAERKSMQLHLPGVIR